MASWSEERVSIFHFRDRNNFEVDVVLENTAGDIVGIEIKAAASVTLRDFGGFKRLASVSGASFMQGILLYNGEQALPFGEKLRAVPIPAFWA
jgi:uncharacterized protein